jgi:cytidine deaminase
MDEELIQIARSLIEKRGDDKNHTVAAAARGVDGGTVAAVNVYHFTGGPCAELVVIGLAASQGLGQLSCIVAAGDRDRGVVTPCGRCRQALLDYHPCIEVIVPVGSGEIRQVPVSDLLPYEFRWDEALQAADAVKRGP